MLALSLVNPVSLRTSEITIFQAEVTIYLYTKGANFTLILSFLPPCALVSCPSFEVFVTHF